MIVACVYKLGVFILGCVGGGCFAVWTLSWSEDPFIASVGWRWCYILVLAIIVGILALFFVKYVAMIVTAWIGSFFTFLGIDVFAQTGFAESVAQIVSGVPPDQAGYTDGAYGMLAGCVALAIVGMVVQFFVTGRGDHHSHLEKNTKGKDKTDSSADGKSASNAKDAATGTSTAAAATTSASASTPAAVAVASTDSKTAPAAPNKDTTTGASTAAKGTAPIAITDAKAPAVVASAAVPVVEEPKTTAPVTSIDDTATTNAEEAREAAHETEAREAAKALAIAAAAAAAHMHAEAHTSSTS